MNKNHFNIHEFRKILAIEESDPVYARTLYEEYLTKYPEDYSAYTHYCCNLITLGEIEFAEKMLNAAEGLYKKAKISKQEEKSEKIDYNILFAKIKLLCYQGKYEEVYWLCLKNMNQIEGTSLSGVWFYSKKRTGRLDEQRRDKHSYLFKQIVNYKEDEFYKHIEKHMSKYNENVDVPNPTYFEESFPIKDVIEEIKKYIPSKKRLFAGFYDNAYYFKYDECGRVNKKMVDYFKVICLHDSKDFITVYPTQGNENLPYIDLNYMKKDECEKVKRKSQIDRFKDRYYK